MGDSTFANIEKRPDIAGAPITSDEKAGRTEENPRDPHAQDSGSPHAQAEREETEPAWQGVPL